MHEYGQGSAIYLSPDRIEQWIGETASCDIRKHHDADGTVGTRKLVQRVNLLRVVYTYSWK